MDPRRRPADAGLRLATRWSGATGTGASSLAAGFAPLRRSDVTEGAAALGRIKTAWNCVLADRHAQYVSAARLDADPTVSPSGGGGLAQTGGFEFRLLLTGLILVVVGLSVLVLSLASNGSAQP